MAAVQPYVSVLMTTYNREKFVGEAIASVLASNYTNFELIVVDDCSSDQTLEIVKKYQNSDSRIKVFSNEKNLGDYYNRNEASKYATGKYIKYVDSDDIIYPDSLGAFVFGMEKFPDAALGIMSSVSQDTKPFPFVMSPREAYTYNFYQAGLFDTGPSALIFRTDRFKEIGGFSGKRFVGDLEINLHLSAKWPIVRLASSLIFWRQHDGQELVLGLNSTGYLEYQLPVLEQAFLRPECPLVESEKIAILKYFRKVSAREILRIAFMKGVPGKAIKICKKLSLSLSDFMNAIFFMKRKISNPANLST
jgi:glycosyltransferase involved in cell wall biosynthesis